VAEAPSLPKARPGAAGFDPDLPPGGPFRIPSTTTTLSRGLGLLVQVLILTGTC